MPRGGKVSIYAKEFKKTAIELAQVGNKTIVEVAKDLNVHPKTLSAWVIAHKKENGQFISKRDENSPEAEIIRLRKALKEVTIERDILKKATAYFAKSAV